jgi:hypothetical protein
VLTRSGLELHRFPDERVVTTKAVTSSPNLARGALAKEKRRERLAIERQHHLPGPHIIRRRTFDGQSGWGGRKHLKKAGSCQFLVLGFEFSVVVSGL